jgi:hypothetical protein
MANSQPIEQYYVPPAPVVITYTLEFEEEAARIFYGLSYKDYADLPGNPEWAKEGISKCYVLQYYRYSKLVQSVSDYASANSKG